MKAVLERALLQLRTPTRSTAQIGTLPDVGGPPEDRAAADGTPLLQALPALRGVIQSGERRRLALLIALLSVLIYLPRIPRLETYLLVSSKRAISLAPSDQTWPRDAERALGAVEARIRIPAQALQQLSSRLGERANQWLESRNCPARVIESYAQQRLTRTAPFNRELERHCQARIDAVLNRERDLLGLTADGHIRLRPSDKVLLAGDSLMQGPATQLAARLRSHGVRPIDASRVSTGLSYPQFFDWPERVKTAIEKEKVDVVIMFLGANDTFDMFDGPRLIKLGSPQWNQMYAQRIEAIASMAQAHKVALLWLGLPAMNRSDIQPHIHAMNQLYSSTVQRHGGLFMPTAEVIGNSEKEFSPTKSIDGRSVLTRGEDGVHFTLTGWSMLADAVMKRLAIQ